MASACWVKRNESLVHDSQCPNTNANCSTPVLLAMQESAHPVFWICARSRRQARHSWVSASARALQSRLGESPPKVAVFPPVSSPLALSLGKLAIWFGRALFALFSCPTLRRFVEICAPHSQVASVGYIRHVTHKRPFVTPVPSSAGIS